MSQNQEIGPRERASRRPSHYRYSTVMAGALRGRLLDDARSADRNRHEVVRKSTSVAFVGREVHQLSDTDSRSQPAGEMAGAHGSNGVQTRAEQY